MEETNKKFWELTLKFVDIYAELSSAYRKMLETDSISQEDLDEIIILEKQLEVIRPQWNNMLISKNKK